MKVNVSNTLFYILGMFTTIQLLSIGGLTAFNVVLIATVLIAIYANHGRIKSDKYFIFSFVATLFTTLIAINNTDLSEGFRHSAIMGGIIYLFVLLLYFLMQLKIKYALQLLKGFELSCKLTLVWCFLQIIFFYALNIDINALIFGNILGASNGKGDYYNGSVIPSGFYSHRAILIPCLLYLIFSTSSVLVMLAIVLIGFLTRSVAMIIGIIITILFKIYYSNIKNKSMKISTKKLMAILVVIISISAFAVARSSEITELSNYVSIRIRDITSNKADNSSVVHFLYYKNFGVVFKKLSLTDIFFGTGFSTSGQHYTWFNGQYSIMKSWVVESDYINIFLSQGVIGFGLWLYLMGKIAITSKIHGYWENIFFILVLSLVGVMYNIQFTWFLLVEMAILVLSEKGRKIFY